MVFVLRACKIPFFTLKQNIQSQDNGFFLLLLLVFYSGLCHSPKIQTVFVLPLDYSSN